MKENDMERNGLAVGEEEARQEDNDDEDDDRKSKIETRR